MVDPDFLSRFDGALESVSSTEKVGALRLWAVLGIGSVDSLWESS